MQRHVDDGYSVHSGGAMTVDQYLEHWLTVVLPARVAAGHMRRTTPDSYDAVVR